MRGKPRLILFFMQFQPVRLQAFISFDNKIFDEPIPEDFSRGSSLHAYLNPLERYLNGKAENFKDLQCGKASGFYSYGNFGLFVKGGQVLVFPKSQQIVEKLEAIKNNYTYPSNSPLFVKGDLAQWRYAALTELDLIWQELYENKNN